MRPEPGSHTTLTLPLLHLTLQLALKLHPDKNRAHKADEAFKAVGKAFACLSDPDKVRSCTATVACIYQLLLFFNRFLAFDCILPFEIRAV